MSYSTFLCAAAALIISTVHASPTKQLDARAGTTKIYGDYTGSTSSYADGSGTYVRSDDVGTYASGVKCWTDLFYVSSSYEAKAWVKDDESIDCATTSVCASGQITAKQACSSWNLAGTVESNFDIIKDIWSVSASFNPGGGRSSCTTASSTNTCSWDDMKCHALWTSNVELINRGYIRRRCHDKGEDYTAWSKDWNVNSPESTTRLGCGASCADTQYPGPVPSVPGPQGKKL
ncbi:MAG: hypothetical protein LQ345_003378 [Seirophora villosa]|nr:MAG: hypothetical protein LQ345_003378 [Seirophora villosa]